jgi:hypothetical protein
MHGISLRQMPSFKTTATAGPAFQPIILVKAARVFVTGIDYKKYRCGLHGKSA